MDQNNQQGNTQPIPDMVNINAPSITNHVYPAQQQQPIIIQQAPPTVIQQGGVQHSFAQNLRDFGVGALTLVTAASLALGVNEYKEKGADSLFGKAVQPNVTKIDVKPANHVHVPNQAKAIHDAVDQQRKNDSVMHSFQDSIKVLSNPAVDKALTSDTTYQMPVKQDTSMTMKKGMN